MSMFRNIIISSNGGGGLPSEYQAVTCLKIVDASGSWIDTSLPVTWGHTIVMDLEPKLYSSNWTTIVCSTVDEGSYRFFYNSEGTAPQASVGVRMTSPSTGVDGQSGHYEGLDEQRRIFTMVHKTTELSISVSDIPSLKYSNVPTYTPANNGYWKFYSQSNGGDRYRGKIYSTKVYDNLGKLILNFVPCYRKSDTIAGMYDLIGRQFYPSASNTPFLYEI